MLAADLALALDPARLFERTVGHAPDPWQTRLLRSTSDRIILNIARQGGKSTTVGALAAHTALFQPGALVLLLSPSLRQSGELFRKTLDAIHAAPGGAPVEAESALRVELSNGSRVVSLPGTEGTIRGYSAVDLLAVDEAARVSDDLFSAVRPMLAVSSGRLLMLSTPWGQRGEFFETWTNGGERWERFEVPATDNPRIDPAFLAEERADLLDWVYRQEYLCEFGQNEAALFGRDLIEGAFSEDVKPLFTGEDNGASWIPAGPGFGASG